MLPIDSVSNKLTSSNEINLLSLVKNENISDLQDFLENNINIFYIDEYGKTLLHHTSNPKVAKLLIKYGCPVNIKDNLGLNPLHYASINNNLAVMDILISSCAIHHDSFTASGLNCLMIASYFNNLEQVEMLIEKYNSNYFLLSDDGFGAMHYATWKSNLDILSFLFEIDKKNLFFKTKKGLDVVDIAKIAQSKEVITTFFKNELDYYENKELVSSVIKIENGKDGLPLIRELIDEEVPSNIGASIDKFNFINEQANQNDDLPEEHNVNNEDKENKIDITQNNYIVNKIDNSQNNEFQTKISKNNQQSITADQLRPDATQIHFALKDELIENVNKQAEKSRITTEKKVAIENDLANDLIEKMLKDEKKKNNQSNIKQPVMDFSKTIPQPKQINSELTDSSSKTQQQNNNQFSEILSKSNISNFFEEENTFNSNNDDSFEKFQKTVNLTAENTKKTINNDMLEENKIISNVSSKTENSNEDSKNVQYYTINEKSKAKNNKLSSNGEKQNGYLNKETFTKGFEDYTKNISNDTKNLVIGIEAIDDNNSNSIKTKAYRTINGENVASATEIVLANMFYLMKMDYFINRKMFGTVTPGEQVPKFTFVNRNGNVIIWEVLIYNPNLADNIAKWQKLKQWYQSNGFEYEINFFMSYINEDENIDSEALYHIAEIIKKQS